MQIHAVDQIFVDSENVLVQGTFQIENAALLRISISEIKATIVPSVSIRMSFLILLCFIKKEKTILMRRACTCHGCCFIN